MTVDHRQLRLLAGQRNHAGEEPIPEALPPMQLYEEVVADYRTAGLSLRAHPISFYRKQLERLGSHTGAADWANWRTMRR